ncbi:NUDIX hydrolase [Microbulbifer sp. GL-2]|uniref:NUDIX hydrolase n=1 Tax=Microbulbifer sp. GL-2 TaxID=2591606 RepID=UPI00116313B4|nr:NUDIX hydrolase [Microbulbifer sp. GL-2]BBM02587.1 ADP-ribose pyrophosphatase [Microbulbifer sp. GL-2]
MKFCSQCGSNAVTLSIPKGDDRPRHLCGNCGAIHYINPRVIVGVLPYLEDRVMLCKRAIEPRLGLWTLPAGFMENGESSEEGALRESWEEARANIRVDGLYSVYDIPHINQVYLMYRGELTDTNFGPGPESLEVDLFREEDIPWPEIAFPIMHKTLEHYFEDGKLGQYQLHRGVISRKLKL